MADVSVLREIAPTARVAPGVQIGPFCVVGPDVTIGPRTVLYRRVLVTGHTAIGSENVFEDGCVVGADPQDLKYGGGPTLLQIGHRNRFQPSVSVHVGTEKGGHVTRIGNDNIFGESCHVAHDCYVDDAVTMGPGVMLAGHVRVQTGAVLEELVGVHHFVTVGRHALVSRRTPVRRDVPPYTRFASADYGQTSPAVAGVHEAGIRAAVLTREEERDLRAALADLFEDESALQTKIEQLVNMGAEGQVAVLCDFCQDSLRGLFGRHRELYRGKTPPEAREFTPRLLAIRQRMELPGSTS